MKKVFKSVVLVAVCFFAVVVAGCKAPSSGGSSSGQGNQSLQKVDSVTKDTVADYIRNLTESGTVKITGDIDGSTFSEINNALDDLFNSDQSIKIKLDMSGLNGVDTIGQNSFAGCLNLESVIIPDGVKNIGDSAFAGCTNLKNVQVPESVEHVGVNAFKDCGNLTEIDYKGFQMQWDEVTLGGNWNSGCPGSMKINYALITKDNVAEYIKSMKQSGTVKITGGMEEETFSDINYALEILYAKNPSIEVELDYSEVTEYCGIGCTSCENLKSITLPDSADFLNSGLYHGCFGSGLCQINVGNNNPYLKVIDGIVYSKDGKTLLCYPAAKEGTSFIVPDGVELIALDAFNGCKNLENIVVSDSVKEIETYAFAFCKNLKSLTIGKGVAQTGSYIVLDDDKLKSINFRGSESQLANIEDGLEGAPENISFYYNVTNKNDVADYIRNMTQSGTVKITGEMDDDTFIAISNVCEDNNGNFTVPSVLIDLDMSETIGVKKIPGFNCNNSLRSISIPASVEEMFVCPFSFCYNIENIIVDVNNPNFKSVDGVLYSKDGKTLISYPPKKSGTSFIIPDTVTSISVCAFNGSSYLESVVIPDTITEIKEGTFVMSRKLKSIKIPDSVKYIGPYAFQECYELESVIIGSSVEIIYERAFMFCRVPTWVIPDSVKEIREYAIVLNYVEIPVITIGYGLEKLGTEAFGDPQQLTINYKGSQTQWNKIEGALQPSSGYIEINFNYTGN